MKRKRLLYKSKVEYMAGDGIYTMNHVLGCSHGCLYCYAFKMARRFGQVEDYQQWCKPEIVENTLELLESELTKNRKEPIKRVFMSFMTDPFPYSYDEDPKISINQIRDLSVEAIKLINGHGIPVTTLSKGYTPRRLAGLHAGNEFGATVTTYDAGWTARNEPGATSAAARHTSLAVLSSQGERTWISIEPFGLIEPNFDYRSKWFSGLEGLLNSFDFVDRIVFGKANYTSAAYKNPAWYRECASIVREFCGDRGIECIIKKGTADE